MARVEIRAYLGADGLAQLEQRLGVIDAEAGVKLKSYLIDAVSLCERDKVFPIGNEHLVPLPLEDLAEVIRPRADDPVGVFCALVVAGAAGEGVYLMQAELLGEQNGVSDGLVILRSKLLVGVDGVAVARKGAYLHAVFGNERLELLELMLIGEQGLGVGMGVTGVAAAAYLDHLDAEGFEIFKGFLKREV